MKEMLDIIHKTIYQFFDACEDDVPMSDKDKLLLEVNKAICNNLKALEQEPCEDCISRERVLLEINRIGFDAFTSYDYYSNLYDFIDGLPSEEPERKTGKWIKRRYIHSDKIIDMKVCSECGYEFSYDAETGISNANGCPNCLADMRCGKKMEVDG